MQTQEIKGVIYKIFSYEGYAYAVKPKTYEMLPPQKIKRNEINIPVDETTQHRDIDLSGIAKRM